MSALEDKPAVARYDDRSLVAKIYQVVDGEYVCNHCGKPAVFSITTQPDGEPGLTCAQHGLEWLDSILSIFRRFSSSSS